MRITGRRARTSIVIIVLPSHLCLILQRPVWPQSHPRHGEWVMTVLRSMERSPTHPLLLLHTSGSCAVHPLHISRCPFFSILTGSDFPLALDSSAVSQLVLLPLLPAPLKPTQNNFFFHLFIWLHQVIVVTSGIILALCRIFHCDAWA